MSRLYISAGKIFKKVQAKRASIKTLALNAGNGKQKIFALVSETSKYANVIRRIVATVPEFKETDQSVLYIMLYEHLFGKGIKGGGSIKRLIKKYDNTLKESLEKIRKEKNVSNDIELLPEKLRGRGKTNKPRYIRLNTLLMKDSDERFMELVKQYDAKKDEHVPNLYVFPPNTGKYLHDHELVKNGHLILQDKSSCFPAYILADRIDLKDARVIDACAAPGNKTSHLAAMLNNRVREIVAFDKDSKRLELLSRRMMEAGANSVKPQLQDFLQTSGRDYIDVRAILLDPSCSGSGMERHNETYDPERLKNLAEFQKKCLRHALSFPNVQRVTYSTCSIYQEENEDVVKEILQDEEVCANFKLIPALPSWKRRGLLCEGLTKHESECLIRVDPEKDLGGGFFVACFHRKKKKRKRLSKKRREKLRERKRRLLETEEGE